MFKGFQINLDSHYVSADEQWLFITLDVGNLQISQALCKLSVAIYKWLAWFLNIGFYTERFVYLDLRKI